MLNQDLSLSTHPSIDHKCTFHPSEWLGGGMFCRVGGEAAHGCAIGTVVEAAGLRVVL